MIRSDPAPTVRLRPDVPMALATLTGIAATAWAATLLIGRIDRLAAPPYDLAFFQQLVWNIGQTGQWVSDFHEGNFLGLHFSPILVAPAIVERLIGPDVRLLSVLHALAIGALVPATFLFLRAALRPSGAAAWLALILAASLPIWGAMQEVIRSDFHPETFGIVLSLLAGWAGLTGRSAWLWGFAIVALCTREDVAYAVFVMGLVVAVRGRARMRTHGRRLAIVAGLWGVLVFTVLMPWLREGAPSATAGYYGWLGGGWAVLVAPFTMTEAVWAALTRPPAWQVVAGMVLSLGGLPLLRPRWALAILPPLLALMLSAHDWQAMIRLQYPLVLVTPLLAATAFGARRALALITIHRRRQVGTTGRTLSWTVPGGLGVILGVLIIVTAVGGAWVQGTVPPFDGRDPTFQPGPAGLDRVLGLAGDVPIAAGLVTDEGLVAPLAGRRAIGRLADWLPSATDVYVLVDREAWAPTAKIARRHDEAVAILERSGRPVLRDDGRLVLWGPLP